MNNAKERVRRNIPNRSIAALSNSALGDSEFELRIMTPNTFDKEMGKSQINLAYQIREMKTALFRCITHPTSSEYGWDSSNDYWTVTIPYGGQHTPFEKTTCSPIPCNIPITLLGKAPLDRQDSHQNASSQKAIQQKGFCPSGLNKTARRNVRSKMSNTERGDLSFLSHMNAT